MKSIGRRMLAASLCLSTICSLMGCSATDQSAEESNVKETVTDMAGNEIEISGNIEKAFCDWASGITLVMTLGAADKLVAIPTAFETETFAWAQEICPSIKEIKKDDDPFTNAEAILNYSPEIVITNNKDNIEIYTNLGLKVVYVDYNSNESFKKSMLIVGTALGKNEKEAAEKYNKYFDDNYNMVKERLSDINDSEKPSVYYMDSRFGDAYHTVGTGEIQEDWITTAGGKLATAADFEGRNLEITAEKFLEIDPDIIMIGAQKQADVYDQLMSDNVLAGLKAIANNAVYRIPQGIFPWCRTGAEAALQNVWAAKLLYPERFEDIDIAEFAKKFYKDFYHTDVSNDVIEGILAGKLSPDGK